VFTGSLSQEVFVRTAGTPTATQGRAMIYGAHRSFTRWSVSHLPTADTATARIWKVEEGRFGSEVKRDCPLEICGQRCIGMFREYARGS
jgi:hypothetical protein